MVFFSRRPVDAVSKPATTCVRPGGSLTRPSRATFACRAAEAFVRYDEPRSSVARSLRACYLNRAINRNGNLVAFGEFLPSARSMVCRRDGGRKFALPVDGPSPPGLTSRVHPSTLKHEISLGA